MSSYKQYKELFNLNRMPTSATTVDWRPVVITGINDDIDTGTVPEDLTRSNGGQIFFPTTSSTLSVVSTSAQDAVGGTGSSVVLVEGLNDKWEEIVELVTLTGLTPVTTAQSFFRLNFVRVVSSGSSRSNVGNITFTHGATVMRTILATEGQAHALVYSTPVGHEFFLMSTRFSISRGTGTGVAAVVNKTFTSTTNSIYLGTEIAFGDTTGFSANNDNAFARLPEKSDTWYTCTYVSANNSRLVGAIRGILVKIKAL